MTLAIALFNDRERYLIAVNVLPDLWGVVLALLLAVGGLFVDAALSPWPVGWVALGPVVAALVMVVTILVMEVWNDEK